MDTSPAADPAFGTADLTNCERELIHLAGSIQPHGVLLVLRPGDLAIVQLSANSAALLGSPAERLLGRPLAELGGDLPLKVRQIADLGELTEPVLLAGTVERGGAPLPLQGSLHEHPGGGLVLELQASDAEPIDAPALRRRLAAALERYRAAAGVPELGDAVAQTFRELTGYDRVMVYQFDPDGHGKIVAEARDARLAPLLGHHYPASDIPQRARQLYLRNRVRVLVDVDAEAAPLQPRLLPLTGADLDMSQCHLRSMSPLHLQYLRNMGVTATLVVSLVHEGRLWGLVAAHHDTPRRLPLALKTACALLAEVIGTRIAAIENQAHAQVAVLVRRLEQRLQEACSSDGDWRLALLRDPRLLLQPFDASGAVLYHDGDVLTAGDVPATPDLRALLRWIGAQPGDAPYACASVSRASPQLDALTPLASGVLAVRLSSSRPDLLVWLRREQITNVTWAGDPAKAALGNDPRELSPRRSFAAWYEQVRGTSAPWTAPQALLASGVGATLADVIVQVHANRLLLGEQRLAQTRAAVQAADQPVLLADAHGRLVFANAAFERLVGRPAAAFGGLDSVAELFADSARVNLGFAELAPMQPSWRSEQLLHAGGGTLPVALRADAVLGRGGAVLGTRVLLNDLRAGKQDEAARERFESLLARAAGGDGRRGGDEVLALILGHASRASLDLDDAERPLAPLLADLHAATERAATLYEQIKVLLGG